MRIKKLNLSKKHLPEDMVMKPEIVKLGNVIGGLNKLLAFGKIDANSSDYIIVEETESKCYKLCLTEPRHLSLIACPSGHGSCVVKQFS
jgi:hypothetical protein